MFTVTEELIHALAPNAAAINNARKISQQGGFVNLQKSEDGTFYMGECKGSGKSNYTTTIDAVKAEAPVFSCSCPSRQFPCKHGLALLTEIIAGKPFASCDIPENIIEKREKREARVEKKKSSEPPKVNKSALAKKIKKQLEGLDLAEQSIRDMLNAGLGAISGHSMTTYKSLAKQLGDYYLPGPQTLLNRIILELEGIKENNAQAAQKYEQIVKYCIQMNAIIKKSRQFFGKQLEEGELELIDSTLYESIGNVWSLAQLKQLGLYKENSELVQLAFTIYYDEARAEFVDVGYWVDLSSGDISRTLNYRPIRALKHLKQDDSTFGVIQAKELYYYPGDLNKRIRYEEFQTRELTASDINKLCSHALPDIATASKQVKNVIKNTLSDPYAAILLRYRKVAQVGESYVLVDEQDQRLLLQDRYDSNVDRTVAYLPYVPQDLLSHSGIMFGLLYYDAGMKRMAMQPYSIVTEEQLVRLLY